MRDILLHPFALGFYTGCFLMCIALYHHFRLKLEHARYKRMLGDKMEIEAATMSKMKTELESVKKENENLRIKVQTLSESNDGKIVRDLEVFARAEKKMMVAAPGFAGPWEQAKQSAYHDLSEEDSGKTTPKRFFQRFFGGSGNTAVEPVKALPSSNGEQKQENAPASAGTATGPGSGI
jgi:hypothetical protein